MAGTFSIRTKLLGIFVGILVSGTMSAAWAHHSFSMYDPSKQYVFTGIVVRIAPNPDHQQVYFVPMNEQRTAIMRNEKGEPIVWMMEMEGAAIAARQGFTVQALPAGTIISTGLLPLRNGQHAGSRGDGASQSGASVIAICPPDTPPEAGKHCDSVKGAKFFGKGTKLPTPTAQWQPSQDK